MLQRSTIESLSCLYIENYIREFLLKRPSNYFCMWMHNCCMHTIWYSMWDSSTALCDKQNIHSHAQAVWANSYLVTSYLTLTQCNNLVTLEVGLNNFLIYCILPYPSLFWVNHIDITLIICHFLSCCLLPHGTVSPAVISYIFFFSWFLSDCAY